MMTHDVLLSRMVLLAAPLCCNRTFEEAQIEVAAPFRPN
jgi:hypothetical protein